MVPWKRTGHYHVFRNAGGALIVAGRRNIGDEARHLIDGLGVKVVPVRTLQPNALQMLMRCGATGFILQV